MLTVSQMRSRSFCSTCHLLAETPIPKLGESSRSRSQSTSRPTVVKPRTGGGILSQKIDKSKEVRPIIRSGKKDLLNAVLGDPSRPKNDRSDSGNRTREAREPKHRKGGWKENLQAASLRPKDTITLDSDARIRIIGFDLTTSLPTIFRTKTSVFRSPLFNLRSIPFSNLPPRRLPPFPTERLSEWRNEQKGRCIYFSAISSKNAVSKLAVERNRSRRRFNSALEGLLNDDVGKEEARGMINNQYAYIASLTSSLHDAPFSQIQSDIILGLKYLEKSQATSSSGSTPLSLPLPLPKYIPRGKISNHVLLPTENDHENLVNRIL
ncbi:hypothetical protein I204_03103 [Kwoniella mangroviensis CBS 8886]|uniref:uncharacterized protein n=1 Tax=Kwoniella mangroviensis CBS 8507 TaxID=1296122 RepID=UPI00080D74A8|nr:uncharacterized protein I203_00160 [Kwoniella mangroviensis CBS 8507]OCF70031.1 hypothetical protein I203_00160 [Kwoniella mangroviensis CBS 8507]OCF75809.1 hypothetical protein I204_03103 [Kwoniella mangroviensis CBS 8886]